MFCRKSVLRNSTKLKGKHLRQSLFFDKVAGLRPVTLIKKEALAHRFYRTPQVTASRLNRKVKKKGSISLHRIRLAFKLNVKNQVNKYKKNSHTADKSGAK